MSLNLGIIRKNGAIINHRSLFKVVFNPVLRLVGLQIYTKNCDGRLGGLGIMRCPIRCASSWHYDTTGCAVEKRRVFI